ncbi:glycosyltransferase family 4 protein [Paractinoplanes durhamensis]|uniref:glycosyltransferase family 4 protein n=1 Tax=Paractinoplanes durhamensis TaxID=113563 RepID=UPI00363A0B2F
MKIGVVTGAYHPDVGGVETHARRLCAALVAAGDEVEVLTQHGVGTDETIDGVLVRRFPLTVAAPNYRFSLALWRYLRDHAGRYDVLHAHSYHALAALPAALTNDTPLVFTPHYHGTGHSRLRRALHPIYRPVGRRLVARSNRLICVTHAERNCWNATSRRPPTGSSSSPMAPTRPPSSGGAVPNRPTNQGCASSVSAGSNATSGSTG